MDRTGMTDDEIIKKCTEYVDCFIKKIGSTYLLEERNHFIVQSYLSCKKYLEKTKESLINKGKIINDNIIIKELVKRSMFWKYIKKEEVMV